MEELSPTDRLATALAQKIEADIVPKPQAAKSGAPTLHISDFVDNRSLLKEAGVLHEADVEVYVKAWRTMDLKLHCFSKVCLKIRSI